MKKVLFSLIILLLGGCYNYNELNDYTIVNGLGIDYDKQEYKVTALVANSNPNKTTTYSSKGKSLYEAINNLNSNTPKTIYTGHLSFLIISEKSAQKGLYNILNTLLQDSKVNKNFYIVLTKDTNSKEILNSKQSQHITNNLETAIKAKNSITVVDFNTLLHQLLDNKNPTISAYSKNKTNIKLNKLAFFKNDKLIGWATKEESIGIGIINNNIKHKTINIECKNGHTIVDISKIKNRIKINNNKIIFNISGISSIKESSCYISDKNLNKRIENEIKTYINKSINLSKKNNIDLFGIKHLKRQKNIFYNYNDLKFIINTNIKLKKNKSAKQNIERILHEKNY